MSIRVSCKGCGWNGTVADSLAKQKIACRQCADPIIVPASSPPIEEEEAACEIIEEEHLSADESKALHQPADPVPAESRTRATEAPRRKIAALRKKKPPLLLSPRFMMILGGTFLLAGFISWVVDLILNQTHAHPYVLIVCGCIIGMTGYAIDKASN